MRRRGRSRRANAGLPHAHDGACAREGRPHGWSGSGRSGKPAENHTKPATLLRLTLSDSGGRGGSEDYAAPENHAAARPPSPRKLQLPACPGRQPALLPDPEGTPLPFPLTPTPAQPQFPPSPQRRSGQLRRAFAARLRHGAAPPARLRLRAAPAAAAPARHGPAAAPCVRHGPRRPPRGFPRNPPADCAAPPRGPVHQRGHKGDFFQREDRVIKSKVHDLIFSCMKRWSRLWVALTRILELQFCFLDLPGTSQSRRLELQHYTLTGIIFCFRERCEELCESTVMVLPENTSVPAGVRSTLDLVQSHLQGPIWVAKTVTKIRNKTP
ncbi:uncharacterized protein [Haliaeetus albicilla]|uniref:uncharacterized protein n=1 Tax=Haliaeetus albicilla TaxID=8969 RepID=UPI0037E87311